MWKLTVFPRQTETAAIPGSQADSMEVQVYYASLHILNFVEASGGEIIKVINKRENLNIEISK